jgi:UDPglucose 6-dehydrogenase
LRNIGVVGLGNVGLCTALCFANKGNKVTGIDLSTERISTIQNGKSPFYERNLTEYLNTAISQGNFSCSSNYASLLNMDFIFITVGTPNLVNGSTDLSQVRSASKSIAKVIGRSREFPVVVVVKSTVTPRTTRKIVKPILERYSKMKMGVNFGLCANPEFLREGNAIEDTLHPDKVVIGFDDERSGKELAAFYESFYGSDSKIILTNTETAELIKYANNVFLATKISYINTIARICEKLRGSDVKKVAQAIGLDSRIGPKFLEAGPGYGGSCFPKDVKALITFAANLGVSTELFHAVENVNAEQVEHVVSMVSRLLRRVKGKKISILGLSFKADTDDVRESPAIKVIERLLSLNAKITVYDPKAMKRAREVLGDSIFYSPSSREALMDSELCIIMTEWKEFTELKPTDFIAVMKRPTILDTRRIYDPWDFQGKTKFAGIGLELE